MSVVDLAAARRAKEEAAKPAVVGVAFCLQCRCEWTGTWEPGATQLECPSCGSMRGRSKFDVMPPADQQIWTCNCGEQFVHITADRTVHCVGCGQQWDLMEFFDT